MFSLDQNTSLRLRYPGFQSFKTAQAIHYRHRYCRIALVLDTLDERVSELAPAASSPLGEEEWQDCIFRRKVGARWETTCIGRPTGQENMMSFDRLLSRDQIKSLTGFDTARLIWERRNTRVTLPTQMVALEVTADERPSTLGEMINIISKVGGTADELLALIANGTLQIDVRSAISPLTTVRQRSAALEGKRFGAQGLLS